MIEKDLDKVLNYMKQYVENVYEHDSEPMLNYKDLQLVLKEIKRLHSIIKEVREYITSIETDYAIGCWNKENEFIDVKKDILEILDKESKE